jgi:hypothetical protein
VAHQRHPQHGPLGHSPSWEEGGGRGPLRFGCEPWTVIVLFESCADSLFLMYLSQIDVLKPILNFLGFYSNGKFPHLG